MASSVAASAQYPTNRTDSTESKLEAWVRSFAASGVLIGEADELEVFADSTGMHVKLPAGSVLLGGSRGDLASQATLDIAPADASDDRIDTVVAQLKRTPTPYTITFKVLTGVAALSPDPLDLNVAGINDATYMTIPIADVLVEAGVGTIASTKITLRRQWTTGGEWIDYVPNIFPVTAGPTPIVSVGGQTCRFRIQGNKCDYFWKAPVALSSVGATGPYYGIALPLPAVQEMTIGVATVQDLGGYVRSKNPGTAGTPAITGGVQILRYNNGNLASDDVYYNDSFTAMYEIAPS